MLGWLAAAAAPILIHLWSRRKYRETTWAAMEYLLAAMKRHSRKLQFEQLLLLLLRTLLVVLIVLAVAKPFLERSAAALMPGGRTHRLLVIDGSYSMTYKPSEQTRFEAAKALARQIVEQSRQGDAFTLVLMGIPPRAVIGTPSLAAGDVLAEIDALTPVHTAFDLPATVAAVEQVLAGAKRELPRIDRHEVIFLTDLGRVGWQPELSAAAAAEFRRRTNELAGDATIQLIDVGQPTAENMAVAQLSASEGVILAGQTVQLEAMLKNFGRQPRSRQSVELFVDGRRVGQQTVDVPAAGEKGVTFSHRFETPGDRAVEVRAEGDSLAVDNHRWLAVPVRRAIDVLCIDGRPSGEHLDGAADYLAYALSPQADPANARVQVEVAPESALVERDLARYDCVILAAVAQFTAAEARLLEGYVRGGGSLVFFLGEGVSAERYNRELGREGRNLLPAAIGDVVDRPQSRLDALEFRHPIVRAFRGRGQTALLTTPVERYFKLAVPDDARGRVALALGNGDPLVVEAPTHRGRVVLVATSADTSWTPMPLWPSYVPLIQEIVSFCAAGELQRRNVAVGQAIGASMPAAAGDVPPSLVGPDGRPRAVQVQRGNDGAAFSSADTLLSGIYTLRFDASAERGTLYAANVDPAEGDLTQITLERLHNEVWPGVPFDILATWDGSDSAGSSIVLPRSGPISVGLLYAALAAALLETVLAWRFGHHTT
jgi:hypothetical protein